MRVLLSATEPGARLSIIKSVLAVSEERLMEIVGLKVKETSTLSLYVTAKTGVKLKAAKQNVVRKIPKIILESDFSIMTVRPFFIFSFPNVGA